MNTGAKAGAFRFAMDFDPMMPGGDEESTLNEDIQLLREAWVAESTCPEILPFKDELFRDLHEQVMCVWVCVCLRARAGVRAGVRACGRACVRACLCRCVAAVLTHARSNAHPPTHAHTRTRIE